MRCHPIDIVKLLSATIFLSTPIRRVLWNGLIDVTETDAEAKTGLSKSLSLDSNTGMLFGCRPGGGMTMRHTSIPLDILFMDSQGHILAVVAAKPLTKELYVAPPNSTMALEVQGGLAAKKGIAPGAIVKFGRQ